MIDTPAARDRQQPSGRHRRPDRLIITAGAAMLAAVALTVGACSSGSGTGHGGTDARMVTIGLPAPPTTLDPARSTGNGQPYMNLAYEPLIYRAPNGSLKPDLAASWNYLGSGNTTFEIHLRPNVSFSDGSPLTAEVVKANFAYWRTVAKGTAVAQVAKQAVVDVVNRLTVRLTMPKPNPILPALFTQDYMIGLISGQALQHPASLATQTDGAGPYVLDTARTIADNHYAYTPNSHYWDKTAVHYHQITIKVIPNANTRLDAIRTGQVDVIAGDYTIVDSARAAGLAISYTPQAFLGLALADRTGRIVPALGDVRVRQAMNYAINRQQIAHALFGAYGTATDQIQLPGQDGHNNQTFYPYDPAKARNLLAAAGYPNGFTLPVLTTSQGNANLVVQAMADELKQVGVRLQLTNDATTAQYLQDMESRRWPAYGTDFGSVTVYQMGQVLFLPGGLYNPFNSSDQRLTALFGQAAAAAPAQRAQLDQQIIGRLAEQGWFVPVVFAPLIYIVRSGVSGVQVSPGEPLADPVTWRPVG